MFDLSGFESGPVAVALTGALLGWVLRPLFLRYRPAFFVAVAAIAVLATLYGLSGEARAVVDAPQPAQVPRKLAVAAVAPLDTPSEVHSLCATASEMARANGGSLAGEPARLVARALALDPDDAVAREMAANASFDEGDYAGALRQWRAIAGSLPPEAAQTQGIDSAIARARLMADASR
jgi:hypothetical protein